MSDVEDLSRIIRDLVPKSREMARVRRELVRLRRDLARGKGKRDRDLVSGMRVAIEGTLENGEVVLEPKESDNLDIQIHAGTTGAAAAALAGYLRDLKWPHAGVIDIVQGEDMGMRSRLRAELSSISGSSIRVSGTARLM